MEMTKETLKTSMVSIGAKLRSAREKRNLAIDQVRKQTYIYSTVLIALEEGRADEILPATYVKSFLKKYSGYLGLESNAILKEYAAIHPKEAAMSSINIASLEKNRFDLFLKFIYGVSLVLLLIASISLVAFLSKRAITFLKRPKASRVLTAVKGKGAAALPKVKAAKKPAAHLEETPKAISIPKQIPLNIVVKVKEAVVLGVKKDGVLLFKRVVPKGLTESFTADKRLEIYVARGEAIELVLNGKSLGSPGKGVIRDLEITRKGIRIR